MHPSMHVYSISFLLGTRSGQDLSSQPVGQVGKVMRADSGSRGVLRSLTGTVHVKLARR